MNSRGFFNYARERYRIKQRRDIGHAPYHFAGETRKGAWTDDPILQRYRFCNIFREDDTTTQWIRATVTSEAYGERLLGAIVIARWFNRIATLERLLPPEDADPPFFRSNLLYNWDLADAWKVAMRERLENVSPLVTGAFIVKTPNGKNKLEGLLWSLDQILPWTERMAASFSNLGYTLKGATHTLAQYPYLGPFMAYEVVTDLRHTPLLCDAPDIMTWANPGPGAIRGAGRVNCGKPDHFGRNRHDQDRVQKTMRDLLEASKDPQRWPAEWPQWEMREVEHTLCEFDKYERARLGQGTPKQRYNGLAG